MLFVLAACGSGSLSAGGVEMRYFVPPTGRNRYEAVVYPAGHPQPVAILVKKNAPEKENPR